MRRILAITLLLTLASLLLWAADTGVTNPIAHDSGWTNSQLAFTQTDTYANGSLSDVVQYTTFGFSIPGGSTIDGVFAETDAYRTGTRNNVLTLNLLNVGTCTEKTGVVLPLSDTDTYEEFGGASDTWVCTVLTAANVNSSSFGVSITAQKDGGPGPGAGSYYLDHIRVTVTYTESGGSRKRVVVMD